MNGIVFNPASAFIQYGHMEILQLLTTEPRCKTFSMKSLNFALCSLVPRIYLNFIVNTLARKSQGSLQKCLSMHTCTHRICSAQPKRQRIAGTQRGERCVVVGLGEYASSWISVDRVLFCVALSISVTSGPLTSHLRWAQPYLWRHDVCLCGGGCRDTGWFRLERATSIFVKRHELI